MIRNGSIVGSMNNSSRHRASGVWDTFDNYNSERTGTWPEKPTVEDVTFSGYVFNSDKEWYERHKKDVTFSFRDLYEDTTFYISYTITTGESLSTLARKPTAFTATVGSGTVGSGTGSVEIEPLGILDRSKSTMKFYFEIKRESTSGEVFYTSETFNVPAVRVVGDSQSYGVTELTPTRTKSWTIWNLGKSTPSVFSVTKSGTATEGVDYYTTLPSAFSTGSSDHISQAFSITYEITPIQDLITEGTEFAKFEISGDSNNKLFEINVTIGDDSLTPNITSVTPNTTSATEGDIITFTVTDSINQFDSDAGPLYYSLNGVQAADVESLNGSFTMTSGSGTFVVKLIADGVAEGESFTASVRSGSVTGSLLGTSPSISITDAAIPLGESLTTAFYSVAEFQTPTQAGNVTDNYSVSEVAQDYNGDGRLYLVQKATNGDQNYGWKNDVPIGCIQVIDVNGFTVNEQWWFGDMTSDQGWTTHRGEYNFGAVGSGVNITPNQASANYNYPSSTHIHNSSYNGGFHMKYNGTGSSDTGAKDGIGEPTGPMPLGLASVPQLSGSYFMYKEQSGGDTQNPENKASLCRSPVRTWTAGERIRIAYVIGNASGTWIPTDTLFFGIQ
jgi:hypothetical protein